MSESSLSENLSKASGKKDSWADSKPVKVAVAVIGIGVGSAIVSQQSREAAYLSSAVIGGSIGYSVLSPLFEFDLNYSNSYEEVKLKSDIEGALIGISVAMGATALRDDRLSNSHKLMIASGIGSLLGFNIVRAEFVGRYPDWANWAGAVIGGVVGAGILYGINKTKK